MDHASRQISRLRHTPDDNNCPGACPILVTGVLLRPKSAYSARTCDDHDRANARGVSKCADGCCLVLSAVPTRLARVIGTDLKETVMADDKGKFSGWIAAIVIALLTAGSAPWWVERFFLSINGTHPTEPPAPTSADTATPSKPKEAEETARMSEPEVGFNRVGGDIGGGFVASDLNDCMNACLGNKSCRAITFNESSRQCWTKESVPFRRNEQGFISSVKRDE